MIHFDYVLHIVISTTVDVPLCICVHIELWLTCRNCYILTLDRAVNQEMHLVNKRKNSGSRWTLNNNITRTQTVWVGWREDASVRISLQIEGLRPSLTHGWVTQPRWKRNAAMVRRTWGQYSSLSLSPAHLSYTINITLSRIKCERCIFIKKCVRSFIEIRHYVWLCFAYICICRWLYNIMRYCNKSTDGIIFTLRLIPLGMV